MVRYGSNVTFTALRILSLFLVQHGELFEVTNEPYADYSAVPCINSVNGSNKI